MKLLVIGGVAGGASVAARVRRLNEEAEIKILERGGDISYSNCSLPYYLGGVVEDAESLIMMWPEDFKAKHNIDVETNSEAISIDRKKKTVTVKDMISGETREETYDKLVLSPGARPVMPASIKGIDGDNVFSVRNVQEVIGIKNYIGGSSVENIVVVGGGFIGIEVAENLKLAGKNVTIIEGLDQILAPYDQDMVQLIQKEILDNGIDIILGTTVTAIEKGEVKAIKGEEELSVKADAVIMAIGVAPETQLAKDAGLDIGETGGIKVDNKMLTSDPDIYAVGDAVEIVSAITGAPGRLALAGPAQKEARVAADNICGLDSSYDGYIGSSCIKVFSLNCASTGLNEKLAEKSGIEFDSVTVYPSDRVGIMPDSNYMAFKLLFKVPGGELIGAQAIGTGDAVKRVDSVAAFISMKGKVSDLAKFEHCYSPVYSTAKDVVNMAALVGENVLSGRMKQVHIDQVRDLVESGAYILDVREKDEYDESHIVGSHNIPTSELRSRLDEIPKDIPVYLHCRTSQRSYYAYRCLEGSGFDNIVNISGSFLGISLYEYFRDKTQGRKPIVTDYNFE